MANTPVTPAIDHNELAAGSDFGGTGAPPIVPEDDPHGGREFIPSGSETPPSAYRMMTLLAILWSIFLFATITVVLCWRWAHSPDRASIALPQILFAATALLLASSATFEVGRRALRADRQRACARWIGASALLGLGFVACQLMAWRNLAARGFGASANPGAFFFYLLTGAFGIHLLIGIGSLAAVSRFVARPSQRTSRENAVSVMGLYWHFLSGLWLYLVVLLLITIQR
jgi:cytochrome c oxidase subunit 3